MNEQAHRHSENPSPRGAGAPKPSKPKRKWSRLALEIGAIVTLYWVLQSWQNSGHLPSGKPAPDFRAQLDGRQVSLSDYRGKKVILHFWATWCGVCRREFSMLRSLRQSLPEDTVLLSVVADWDNPELSQFLSQHQIDYPVMLNATDALRRFGVDAFPTNYFVDEKGLIRDSTVGMSTSLAMRARNACNGFNW